MRRAGWLLACIMGLLGLGGELPGPETSRVSRCDSSWRRTDGGWEQLILSAPPPDPNHPALHPAIVAVGQALLSLLALVVWDSRAKQ